MATHNKFEQEVNKAKSKSILDVAHNLGMELRHISRDIYEWTEHDSFRIFANKNDYHWFSKGQGGDVIHLVQTVSDVSFKEAVSYLNTGEFKTYEKQEIKQEPFEYYLKRFEKPDFKEGYDYMENERGLSRDTIDFFGEKGVLAQATKKSGRIYEPVIVFKTLDTSGEVIGASLQGINSYPEIYPGKGRLKQIMGCSDGLNGFHVDIGTPKRLVVAEAPIDLMSYYELHKDSLQDVRLLAMDGLKEGTISRHVMELRALQQGLTYVVDREKTPKQLESLAKVTNFFKDGRNQDLITLAVDNDEAGQNFIKKLEDKGIPVVVAVPPSGKDWNEYLNLYKQGDKEMTQEKPSERRLQVVFQSSDEQSILEKYGLGDIVSYDRFVKDLYEENRKQLGEATDLPAFPVLHLPDEGGGTWFGLLDENGNTLIEEFRYDIGVENETISERLGRSIPSEYLEIAEQTDALFPKLSLPEAIENESGIPVTIYSEHQKIGTIDLDDLFNKGDLGSISDELGYGWAVNPNRMLAVINDETLNQVQVDYLIERMIENGLSGSDLRQYLQLPGFSLVKYAETGDKEVQAQEDTVGQSQEPNYNASSSHRNSDSLGDENESLETEISPEDQRWLKENWDNITFTVQPPKTITGRDEASFQEPGSHPDLQAQEKAPESLLEQQIDRTSGSTGFSQLEAEGSTKPVLETSTFERTVTSRPTSSYPYLHFSTNYAEIQRRIGNYHPITPADLKRLNQYAASIQSTAQWYLDELADSKISYVYLDGGQERLLEVNFQKENFIHLAGIRPFEKGKQAADFLVDFAEGRGDFEGLLISNAIKDKLQILPMLQDILDPESFVLDDLSSVEKLHNINLTEAIKAKEEDFLLLFKDTDQGRFPASLMKLTGGLSLKVSEIEEKVILGIYRERGSQFEQIKVNNEYIQDGGLELQSILQNNQLIPVAERSKEDHAAEVAAYIDSITAGGQGYNLWHDEELENLGAPDRAFIEFHETTEEITYKNNTIDLFVKDSVNDGITGFLSLGGHTLDDEHGILQYMSDWNIKGEDQITFLAELESAVESIWDKVTDAHNEAFEKICQKYKLTKEIEPGIRLNKHEFTNLLDATREFGVAFFKKNKTYRAEHPVAFAKLLELESKDTDFDQMVVAALKEDLIRLDSDFYKEWLEDKVYDRFKVTSTDVLNGVVTVEQLESFKLATLKELMEGPAKAAPTILEDSVKNRNTQVEKEEQEAKDTRTISQIIADKDTKALSKRMKDGVRDYFDSDTYKTFLTAMSKFHNYSPRNIQLILAQNPDAVHVASFKKWKEDFERNVMKGSKSLRVWAPVQYQIKDPETGEPILDDKGKPKTEITFRLVPVFDISQTEGKELPKQVYELEGTYEDYGNLYKTFREVSLANNVPISFSDDTGDANGYYHVERNEIVIKKGMSEQQTLRTIIYEMAHSELHNKEQLQGQKLTRSNAELQAESVAYVVANHFGLDTSDYTFGYLASWTQDAAGLSDLEAQLQIVQKEANSLIQRMDATLEKYKSKEISKDAFQTKLEKAKSKNSPEAGKEEAKEASKKTPTSNQDLSL
ncbi:TPA: toprim domain-containing protein [Streptococcus suis]|nr:toprim domain-containing protein [Streptococcus suis]